MKKTIQNSSFHPEQDLSIKGIDFMSSNLAVDSFLDNMKAYTLPLHYKWIDNDGEPVENPNEGQKKDLKHVFDPFKTYNSNNIVEALVFKANSNEELSYEFTRLLEIVENKRRILEIWQREVDAGNTILVDDLLKELDKPRTEVVD